MSAKKPGGMTNLYAVSGSSWLLTFASMTLVSMRLKLRLALWPVAAPGARVTGACEGNSCTASPK